MPEYSRAIFFYMCYCRFCSTSHFAKVITNRIQNPVCKLSEIRSNQPNHGCAHTQIAKIGLFLVCFEKFGQGALLKLVWILLHISLISSLTIMTANSGAQVTRTALTTSKTVFTLKFLRKSCQICTYFAKFEQHSIWELDQILLHNLSVMNLNWMASKPRDPTS